MANFKALKGEGHWPTLLAAFLYFDFSFMVWTMLGPLVTEIDIALQAAGAAAMTSGQMATLLSLPILSGAILRIVLGFGVDKLGPKKTALISQGIVIVSLFFTYFQADTITYNQLLVVALGLGFAGASFAVALPQAGQWYPPKLQGIVLGIAGAGNIGVVVDFLFAPKIAEHWGWATVFLVGAVLSSIIFVTYLFMAKDAPASVYKQNPKKLKDYGKLLKGRERQSNGRLFRSTYDLCRCYSSSGRWWYCRHDGWNQVTLHLLRNGCNNGTYHRFSRLTIPGSNHCSFHYYGCTWYG